MIQKIPVTIILILANVGIYILMLLSGADWLSPSPAVLLKWGANFDGLTLAGEPWRLLTCTFLHGGALHLVVNMYGLLSLGPFVEMSLGWKRYTALYLIAGLAGSITSLSFHLFTIGVGASGAIFGLAGAEVLLFFFLNNWNVARKGLINFIVFIFLNLTIGMLYDQIDIAAHAGGLIAGMLVSLSYLLLRNKKTWLQLMLTVFLFIPALTAVYLLLPSYPAEYFRVFKKIIENEERSDNLSESISFTEEMGKYRQEIMEAKDLLDENIRMLKTFDSIPSLQPDVQTLVAYNSIKKSSVDYILKSIEKGSLIYFDTAGIVYNYLDTLPQLNHRLGGLDEVYSPKTKGPSADRGRLKTLTIYYDENWEETTKSNASYFRNCSVDSIGRAEGFVFDYYASGILQMKGPYTQDLKHGIFFYYHPNGKYESVGVHIMDNHFGKWQHFYPDGKLMKEEKFAGDSVLVLNYFDRWGNQTLVNGNGIIEERNESGQPMLKSFYRNGLPHGEWLAFYEDGKPWYREQYENGKLVMGESRDRNGRKYTYTEVRSLPVPSVSWEEYTDYLTGNMHLSPLAVKMKVNGRIVVEVTVSESGKVLKAKALNKLGYGCEKEAERLVSEGPDFRPGKLRGQLAEMKTIVSVKF